MKRFFKFLLAAIIIVVAAFSIFEFSNKYRISSLKNNINLNIYAKNCKDAVGFDKDEEGNTYIAYKTYIKSLKSDGRENIILEDYNFNIENVLYYDKKLFFVTNDKLMECDIDGKKVNVILDKIPSEGRCICRNLIIKDSHLLLSIGAATNSGIADKEDYNDYKVPYDKSPINITLNGVNLGENKTGAFVPYGNSTKQGEKIKAENLGNASIVDIDLNNKKTSLYACGIRNITGWDLDSEDNLIGIVGGMENVGDRPVQRDSDYIYKIDKGAWYGWPDFSGGDPISSPKFKDEKLIKPLIANPPNNIVCAPLYAFEDVGIIKYLAIDKSGNVLDKNSKVFYNKKNNIIEALSYNNIHYELLKMKDESIVSGIKYFNDNIYILDSGIGCIYKLHYNKMNFKFNLSKPVWIFLLVFGICLLMVVIMKENKKRKIENNSKGK